MKSDVTLQCATCSMLTALLHIWYGWRKGCCPGGYCQAWEVSQSQSHDLHQTLVQGLVYVLELHLYKSGSEWIASSPHGEGPGETSGWISGVCLQTRKPIVPLNCTMRCMTSSLGEWFHPSCENLPGVLCPAVRPLEQERHGPIREGPWKRSALWNTYAMKKDWDSWGSSAWRWEGLKKILLWPSYT